MVCEPWGTPGPVAMCQDLLQCAVSCRSPLAAPVSEQLGLCPHTAVGGSLILWESPHPRTGGHRKLALSWEGQAQTLETEG